MSRKREQDFLGIPKVGSGKGDRIEVNPVLGAGFGLVKRGIFGPSSEERLARVKGKLKSLKAEKELVKVEKELARMQPKKRRSFLGIRL